LISVKAARPRAPKVGFEARSVNAMKDFFQFAVIGPTGTRRMGVASGCTECRESQASPPRCDGFGAGCLGLRGASRDERPTRDDG